MPSDSASRLPDTSLLDAGLDHASDMVAGMHRFLDAETAAAAADRGSRSSLDRNEMRARLRRMLGVVDDRLPSRFETIRPVPTSDPLAPGDGYDVLEVRWDVLRGITGAGLLCLPEGDARGNVVVLPDCDTTPEQVLGLDGATEDGIATLCAELATAGYRVLVPCLVSRDDTHSGIPGVRMTNQPHREYVYRAAFEVGRHIIGYEVQRLLAAADAFDACFDEAPLTLLGYGEGGALALYASALDARVSLTGLSGYFGPREGLWREPIYRNVFGLLREHGDAELAALVSPRALLIEAARHPEVDGPPHARDDRGGAAPGAITTPNTADVHAVADHARALAADASFVQMHEGDHAFDAGLRADVLRRLGVGHAAGASLPRLARPLSDTGERAKRQFTELVEDTQALMRESEYTRKEFWAGADATNEDTWRASAAEYRERMWQDLIGKLPAATRPPNAQSRLYCETPAYTGYEIRLDVYPDVFAQGILLVPHGAAAGPARPVVVCQHGLEGRPRDLADPTVQNDAYHKYACRLAERGFITFSPQNPYIGEDDFRSLQRKANPLGLSLFSLITRQHERTIEWLADLPYVDRDRIAFYGLSYGGKTAMRVPALLEGYCLSICSADYNEWVWKNTSSRSPYSYLVTGEYEMFEFDLANTFNYAEMSWLICPRPFMVERGHHDGVAPDEWVAYEFAKTRRRYVELGIADRVEMEFFDGPHTINGDGTFAFLHHHLDWPRS